MPFSKLGLSDSLVQAITEQGYQKPTPIQQQAIPEVLAGKDLIAAAQTGTGKTASFVLPILQQLDPDVSVRAKRVQALILVPTRELAIQVENNIQLYGKHLNFTSMAMFGGSKIDDQKQRLIEGVDLLVATPGRLIDMLYQRALQLDELKYFVLDEADRMLDMGFIADINRIIERLPAVRQNLLFSATLSEDVRLLARTALHHAVEIKISESPDAQPKIDQWIITVDKDAKSALLSHLITDNDWDQALIFIRTKHGAAKLATQLEKRGIAADTIHSGRSQAERTRVLAEFKSGKIRYLVATDVAARGIDIDQLSRVVNYDLPQESQDYIHRIGRTGRAGASGEAISLTSKDDFKNLCAIESRLNHLLERRTVEGFTPKKEVPVSILNYVPKNGRVLGSADEAERPRHKRKAPDASEKKGERRSKPAAGRGNTQKRGQAPQRRSEPSNRSESGNKPVDPWAKFRK
ncbi:DEAD/DEAH box helicase [Oceanospirillum maris]|uniref:DEAD/DEAH box helicase n=1 Tax=Oceanospirillum maris TaxID=64977 RepID=UPI0003FD18E6|nr:DEAD/DEAH box helicase [Oceanospirillum maris]